MNSKQAIKIAQENGYNIGRRGKKGYYLTFVKNGQVVRQQMPAEANLSAVVRYIQANPIS